jgi:Coenzyme PQQ synthesis protein D (PqqD)
MDDGHVRSGRPMARDGLDLTETEDGLIVYDQTTDRVHHLNPTAAVILSLCNGTMTVEEIAHHVGRLFDTGEVPTAMTGQCVRQLERENLIYQLG